MTQQRTGSEIAIIGMTGRFPGAHTIEQFWHNLQAGVESITRFDDDELIAAGVDPVLLADERFVKAGAVLHNAEYFDAGFFGFSPREAETLDPQQRVFLECAWEALEHAGYNPEAYKGSIGVYAGAAANFYLFNLHANSELVRTTSPLQLLLGNDKDYLATRVSYKLNLQGPSVSVQTACSTSLVAVHLACQSLLSGECDMALAGGVAIHLPQTAGYVYQEGDINSPDGHCRTFDARAQGTVFGNGVGLVVLKRLDDALDDGDTIQAVIRGSAINNDGALKVGYTAPRIEGQAKVIRAAQVTAEVDPETISYIEAHGTGTPLGDPIEITALTRVFRLKTQRTGFCGIGSVKTNIGHLDTAAGIAGLIKTVLALRHRQIPPSLHFEQPNPQINWASSPFYVNTELRPWEAAGTPRRGGVSSFGIGGTNAHVILEEAPAPERSGVARPYHLLVLSARSGAALEQATTNLQAHLRQHPDLSLADVAYTLQVGRKAFSQRRIVVCRSVDDVLGALQSGSPQQLTSLAQTATLRPAFMFPGQGAQYPNMGRELYEHEPVFRAEVDRCARLLLPHLQLDLRQVLYPAPAQLEYASQQLRQTRITQPALFVIEYALAQLWISWGIRPVALIGHSVGEYVAACLSEVFTLEDALALIAMRGQLMQQLPPGGMLAVALPPSQLQPLLGADLDLAAINTPSRCVVSGPTEAVDRLEQQLAAQGVEYRRLHTSHAFHSAMMEPVMARLAERVRQMRLRPPTIPFVSNVSGTWITPEQATDPAYWARQLREPVRFADGLRELLHDPDRLLLEVGPGTTLSSLARQHPDRSDSQPVLTSLPHAQEQASALAHVLTTLGRLWLAGAPIDWAALHDDAPRQRVPLPTYPFERQRYWIERVRQPDTSPSDAAPLDQRLDLAQWFSMPSWQQAVPPVGLSIDKLREQTYSWLIFADDPGLGDALAQQLVAAEHVVVTVRPGPTMRRLSASSYTLNPQQPQDYQALLAQLRLDGCWPDHVVHLWSVTSPAASVPADTILQRGFYSLIWLLQAFGNQPASAALRISVVSNDMQRVTGAEQLCAEKATLIGPCAVIPQEYPSISCQSIDLTLPAVGSWQAQRLVGQLLAECLSDGTEPLVAYRPTGRWVRRFAPVRLDQAARPPLMLREAGVYLITGGLGGIGLTVADYLARAVRARLVLIGRTALPPRAEWDAWLQAHDAQDAASQRIRRVQALEALGAEVLLLNVDVAGEDALRTAVAQAVTRFGPINGVFHAAGVSGGGVIQRKTLAEAAQVLAPKLGGTRALEAALADQPLDLWVLFSSTIALTGGFGQVGYCAANAFLDAFAHERAVRSETLTVSINWDAWREVGMAVDRGWFPATQTAEATRSAPAVLRVLEHPLVVAQIASDQADEVYSLALDPATQWVLAEHRIMGTPVVPGTAYLEMARAALAERAAGAIVELEDVVFIAPLLVPDAESQEARLLLTHQGEQFDFQVVSSARSAPEDGDWQVHAQGRVALRAPGLPAPPPAIDALIARCDGREITVGPEHAAAPTSLVTWGPRWQSLERAYVGDGEALALLTLPDAFAADLDQFGLHPALLDVATSFAAQPSTGAVYLPLSYRRLAITGALSSRLYSYARSAAQPEAQPETLAFDITILDQHGRAVVEIAEFTMRRVHDTTLAPARRSQRAASTGQLRGITNSEGIDALERILTQPVAPQLVVATHDLSALIAAARVISTTEGRAAAATGSTYSRPELATPYAAPSNEIERQLAELWQALLGIERIGVHDNFFEMGGDSMLAVQIIARANQIGLRLTANHVFQHQTIAELAAVLGAGAANGSDVARLPLTPTQQRFLAAGATDRSAWSQTLLIEARQPLDVAQIRAAVQAVLAYHEVFSLRLEPSATGWRQLPGAGEHALTTIDLADLPERDRPAAVRAAAVQLRASLDLAVGPPLRVGLIVGGPQQPCQLLIVLHGLVADAGSWRILLEDLQTACQQLRQGEAVQLPPTTAPLAQWIAALTAYAQSPALTAELDFWRTFAPGAVARLPRDLDLDDPSSTSATPGAIAGALEPQATHQLLQTTYRAHLDAVVLAALARALADWTATPALLLDLIVDGRTLPSEQVDVSRTVGCGCAIYPLLLDISAATTPVAILGLVRDQLRLSASHALSYDLLRFGGQHSDLAAQLGSLPRPEISFSYLGELDRALPVAAPFGPARLPDTLGVGGWDGQHQLAVHAWLWREQLQIELVYDAARYQPPTMQQLLQRCLAELQALVTAALSAETAAYNTADFPLAQLSQHELSSALSKLKQIKGRSTT